LITSTRAARGRESPRHSLPRHNDAFLLARTHEEPAVGGLSADTIPRPVPADSLDRKSAVQVYAKTSRNRCCLTYLSLLFRSRIIASHYLQDMGGNKRGLAGTALFGRSGGVFGDLGYLGLYVRILHHILLDPDAHGCRLSGKFIRQAQEVPDPASSRGKASKGYPARLQLNGLRAVSMPASFEDEGRYKTGVKKRRDRSGYSTKGDVRDDRYR
jgi:hypothetical protein